MKTLEEIVIEPKEKAEYAVIWLHGLGADGHDFAPIVPELGFSNVRFIFPHAPLRPVTLNSGMVMRAWYDVSALRLDAKEDEAGIRDSQKTIMALIERQEQSGIAANRIFLVGFSQGGAMALHTGLRSPQALAGIIALSAYLPLREKLTSELAEAQLQTPIFMAHGMYDMILPYVFGEGAKKLLQGLSLSIEWHSYPMDHSVSTQELADIKKFLNQRMKN